jgi:hypothetical protein
MPGTFTATTGPLAGFTTVDLDVTKLTQYLDACVSQHIRYGLGAKAPPGHVGDYPPDYTTIDCSGWIRAATIYSTFGIANGPLVIPDGSVNQHDWFDANHFKAHTGADYSTYAPLTDNILRIAFISPDSSPQGIGHVWYVQNGVTFESHAPNGPSSRPWNTPVLVNECSALFVVRTP